MTQPGTYPPPPPPPLPESPTHDALPLGHLCFRVDSSGTDRDCSALEGEMNGGRRAIAGGVGMRVLKLVVFHVEPSGTGYSCRLVGLVVKASASRVEDPGFESRDYFRGRVIPVT